MKFKYNHAVFVFLFLLVFVVPSLAARVPTVSGDANQWGTILNQYLQVEHTVNGTHANITADSINVTKTVNISSGFLVVNTTAFFVDPTGKIGIGTSSPNAALHVTGNVISTGTLFGQLAASNVTAGTFSSGSFTFPNNLVVTQNLTVSNNVLFIDNSSGRIGVLTTSPNAALHVAGNILSTGTLFGQLAASNLTGFVTQAQISGITIPFGNTTGQVDQSRISGITIPLINASWNGVTIAQSNITGITIPFDNTTGQVAQSRISGITLPAANLSGFVTQAQINGITIPFGNTTGQVDQSRISGITIPLVNASWSGVTIAQSNITGITIPANNVTNGTFASTNYVFPENVTINRIFATQHEGNGSLLFNLNATSVAYGFLSQSFISGITIPLVNASWNGVTIAQSNITGITIPFDNTTGQVAQSRISGITIPLVNASWNGVTIAQSNITGITIPLVNASWNGVTIAQSNITGITIPLVNASWNGVTIAQSNITGITIPANNVTNGTFANNTYVFPTNITVGQGRYSGITLYNDTGSAYCLRVNGTNLAAVFVSGACGS